MDLKKEKFLSDLYSKKEMKSPVEVLPELYEPLVKFIFEKKKQKKIVHF